MTVAATSRMAYEAHAAAGKVSAQQQQLLDAMEYDKAYSRLELVGLTNIELSSVCGLVKELLQIGMLAELSPRPCKVTGMTVRPVTKGVAIPGLMR